MSIVSLKSIIGKKNETAASLLSLIVKLQANVWIEDAAGNVLLGQATDLPEHSIPINTEEQVIGFVKGNSVAETIASILSLLLQKETERKKLGAEVLNLYREINLIFNFSEKLAQTIDPAAITQLTLDEAMHSITSDSGVVVLWDEETKQLHTPATSGERLFNEEKLSSHVNLLLKIGLSGQSEIMSDVSSLADKEIIKSDVQSLIYASLKVKHRIMGAIILASKESIQYSAGALKLLVTLALQSSSAIESALQYEKNIREAREREEAMRRIHEVTKKFVPFEFIQSLGRDVLTDLRLGDQVEKVVTVLFTDIRDYTTLSEQMTPEENFAFVCAFNERMGPIIRKHKGFINQYQGDAIMAIFPDTASGALAAAVEMQQTVREFNNKRKERNLSEIRMGIGMHTGPLIMGITGDNERLDATTISDTVNTASRLESLTKYYKVGIILSDITLNQVMQKEKFFTRSLGPVQLKGKQSAVNIYECFSGYPETEINKKLSTLATYNEGLHQYLNKSFEPAVNAFETVCELDPDDLTARLFLATTLKFIKNGVPENWAGVEEMLSK
ncbi:MAG: adenylate/guanylate cyclase domain-containing protein [Sphingobacteriales bacterium]